MIRQTLDALLALLDQTLSEVLVTTCGPCTRGHCMNCEGAIGPTPGQRRPCKCRLCHGFGQPTPTQHGGSEHTCTADCWGHTTVARP